MRVSGKIKKNWNMEKRNETQRTRWWMVSHCIYLHPQLWIKWGRLDADDYADANEQNMRRHHPLFIFFYFFLFSPRFKRPLFTSLLSCVLSLRWYWLSSSRKNKKKIKRKWKNKKRNQKNAGNKNSAWKSQVQLLQRLLIILEYIYIFFLF